jgi:putative transposase
MSANHKDQLTNHSRRSYRMKGFDYSLSAAYFVTIVTYNRLSIFGDNKSGEDRLNQFGEIAEYEWYRSSNLRPYIQLFEDEFIVMPNHIHGIIHIINTNETCRGAALPHCPTTNDKSRGAASLRPYRMLQPSRIPDQDDASLRPSRIPNINSINVTSKSLGAIIRAYKSAVTYRINAIRNSRGSPVWQRNYYDHVIRSETEYQGIWNYIEANPMNYLHDYLISYTV